ncbi:MAG TPA: sulfite exporter TauE/SafE family protein [Rhodopila sp.]
MGPSVQVPPLQWQAVLYASRKKQSQHLAQLASRLCHGQNGTLFRRLALVAAGLVCAALAAHRGLQAELAVAAVGVAAAISSIAGFAFSAIGGAMLFHLSADNVQVVQIMVTCSIANQVAMTWASYRDIRWRELSVYLAGGGLGLIAGVWLLLHVAHARYAPGFGVFLSLYGTYMLVRKPVVVRRQHPAIDFAVGFLGGVTGGASGFPGAFITIWCGMKGWDKARQRAVFQPFILIMQVAALVGISMARSRTGGPGFSGSTLLFVPGSLIGTLLGLSLYRRLSDSQFARFVNILLIASGVSYIA